MLIEAALQTGGGSFECLKHDEHVNKVFLKYLLWFGFGDGFNTIIYHN